MKHTKNSLIKILQDEYKETGKIPTSVGKRRVHSNVFRNHFGKWDTTLEAAGIPLRDKNKAVALEKICPHCDTKFTVESTRDKTFCSIKCSNESRRIRPKKIYPSREEWREDIKKKSLKRTMETPFNELGWDTKRKRVIMEQDNKCNKCGTVEWMGEIITLEVDHISGDNTDNRRENLEGLCPNCHSITPTWRGKNKACSKVTDEELKIALEENVSIRQALLSVGMAAKGANYRRATRLSAGLDKYEYMKKQ